MAKTFNYTKFSTTNNNAQVLVVTGRKALETNVTVWESFQHYTYTFKSGQVHDTYGEPSIISVTPTNVKVLKRTSIDFKNNDHATTAKAVAGAAENTVMFYEQKCAAELEAMSKAAKAGRVQVDSADWNAVMKENPSKLVKVAGIDQEHVFGVVDGKLYSNVILLRYLSNQRIGKFFVGVINTEAWNNRAYLDITLPVVKLDGSIVETSAMLRKPAQPGFYELYYRDELTVGDLITNKEGEEETSYRASFYRILKSMAEGEAFTADVATWTDSRYHNANFYTVSKAKQMVRRFRMDEEAIKADKLAVILEGKARKQEQIVGRTAQAMGQVPAMSNIVTAEGEVVGRKFDEKVTILVNGKPLSVVYGTEIPAGDYELVRSDVRGTKVRNITVYENGLNLRSIRDWAANRYQLRSIAVNNNSNTDYL